VTWISGPQLWWDIGKNRIRSMPIEFCTIKREKERSVKTEINKQITRLTYDLTVRNRDVETGLVFYKEKLWKVKLEKAEGYMTRSRV